MYAGFEHTYVYATINEEPISGRGFRFKFSEENYLKLKTLDDNSDPFGGDAYRETTFLMAYSRKTNEPLNRYNKSEFDGKERKERWFDVVIRVIEGTMTFYIEHMTRNRLQYDLAKLQSMAYEMAWSFYKMHWTGAGRCLFGMGTEHTYKLGNSGLNNCYATDVSKNLIKSMVWAMDVLMTGAGVGFSTAWNGKVVIPNKEDKVLVVIPDSREGWCIALEMIMRAYIPDKHDNIGKFPVFDYSLIRPYGSPIKGFGGTASGPEPLRVLLERVEVFFDTYLEYQRILSLPVKEKDFVKCYLDMFNTMVKRKIYQDTSFDADQIRDEIIKQSDNPDCAYTSTRLVADIANAIGICIISGNVRRSSQILLGEPDDNVFLNLKNYMLHPLRRPLMYMSNNTVRLWNNDQFEKYLPKICSGMRDNGEPGVLNMINVQKYGRFSDTSYGPDPGVLTNPCGEIILSSFEPCCLSVVAPTKCLDDNGDFSQDLLDNAVKWATLYAMIVTTIPHHWSVTNKIIQSNRRIGVSLTGMVDFYERYGTTKTIAICKSNYKKVREVNKKYARKMGIRESIRCTTSKPDGTIGIVLGTSPGANFPIAKYAKRRVCYDKSNPIVKVIEKAGYEIEPSTLNSKQVYAIFPIKEEYSRTERESSMFEKLALIELIQRHFVDNSVSCTISFNPVTEGHLIEKAIAMHIPQLKCLSAFPQFDIIPEQYRHLPVENITREKYDELISLTTHVDKNMLYGINEISDASSAITEGCTGGVCMINK